MIECSHCGMVNDVDHGPCRHCGAALRPTRAVVAKEAAVVSTTPIEASPAVQRQEEAWLPSALEIIMTWVVVSFGAYLLWVYAMPHFWSWAGVSWGWLWSLLQGWLLGAWWPTPWGFFQVLFGIFLGIVVLLAWLVTAIPVIFVLAVTLAAAIPIFVFFSVL